MARRNDDQALDGDLDGGRDHITLSSSDSGGPRPQAAHPRHGRVENSIKALRDTGLGGMSFRASLPNGLAGVRAGRRRTTWPWYASPASTASGPGRNPTTLRYRPFGQADTVQVWSGQ